MDQFLIQDTELIFLDMHAGSIQNPAVQILHYHDFNSFKQELLKIHTENQNLQRIYVQCTEPEIATNTIKASCPTVRNNGWLLKSDFGHFLVKKAGLKISIPNSKSSDYSTLEDFLSSIGASAQNSEIINKGVLLNSYRFMVREGNLVLDHIQWDEYNWPGHRLFKYTEAYQTRSIAVGCIFSLIIQRDY